MKNIPLLAGFLFSFLVLLVFSLLNQVYQSHYLIEMAPSHSNLCCEMSLLLCLGLNSAEVYDPRLNEWRYVACMSTRRSSVGVGVVAGLSLFRL